MSPPGGNGYLKQTIPAGMPNWYLTAHPHYATMMM